MTTITRQQQMIEWLKKRVWLADKIHDLKEDKDDIHAETYVEMLKAILAELQKVDEHTLPELPENWSLSGLGGERNNWDCAIIWGMHRHFGNGLTPRQAVLRAVSKIPTDSSEER